MIKGVNKEFKIFTFRAIDEPEICKEYLNQHLKRLNDYGINKVTSNNKQWINNPFVYCTVAIDNKSKELVGGVRIQIADGKTPLPINSAIGKLKTVINANVKKQWSKKNVCESCGLWIAENAKGMGLSRFLMHASLASASQLNIDKIIGICGKYTLNFFTKIGFEINDSIHKNGDILYSLINCNCYVLEINDVKGLSTALKEDKKVMLSLRRNPITNKLEFNKSHKIYIQYDLTYDNITKVDSISENSIEKVII
tara:strand:+ start:757 stop:1518 length:762 start_codon:yes stop_codon:yes gene_type:complete